MDEFYEGRKSDLREEFKEGIIQAVLVQRAFFGAQKGLDIPYVWFVPKQAYI